MVNSKQLRSSTMKPRTKRLPCGAAKESLELFRTIIDGAREHGKVKEEETTKRSQIEAELKRDLEKIKAQRKFLEDYLHTTFEERRNTLDKMFETLDYALSEDRDGVAIQALSSIEGIVKSSPLEALLLTQRALDDQDQVLEI